MSYAESRSKALYLLVKMPGSEAALVKIDRNCSLRSENGLLMSLMKVEENAFPSLRCLVNKEEEEEDDDENAAVIEEEEDELDEDEENSDKDVIDAESCLFEENNELLLGRALSFDLTLSLLFEYASLHPSSEVTIIADADDEDEDEEEEEEEDGEEKDEKGGKAEEEYMKNGELEACWEAECCWLRVERVRMRIAAFVVAC